MVHAFVIKLLPAPVSACHTTLSSSPAKHCERSKITTLPAIKNHHPHPQKPTLSNAKATRILRPNGRCWVLHPCAARVGYHQPPSSNNSVGHPSMKKAAVV